MQSSAIPVVVFLVDAYGGHAAVPTFFGWSICMEKIKRVSLFFRIIFQLLFIFMPAMLGIAWLTSPDSFVSMGGVINMSFIPRIYSTSILHELTNQDRLLGFLCGMIPVLVELYILYALIKLFKLYEKGEIFTLNNVRYIRRIGYGLLLTQMINPVYEALMGVILTWNNPPGYRIVKVTLDQTNIGIIFAALIVILISWIMAEGCKLHEEQQLTI